MADWCDLNKDGLRLYRIIRILEKRFKKTDDDEKLVRYATCIGILTEKKVNIAKLHLGIKDALDQVEVYAN